MQRWGEEDVKTADYQMLILCQGRGWLNMKIVIIVHNKAHTNDNDNRYKSMHWTRETFSNFSLPILIALARSDCLLPILCHCSQHSALSQSADWDNRDGKRHKVSQATLIDRRIPPNCPLSTAQRLFSIVLCASQLSFESVSQLSQLSSSCPV